MNTSDSQKLPELSGKGQARRPPEIDHEAVEFQPDGLAIEATRPPFIARTTLLVIALVIVAAFTWAGFAYVDLRVVATGRLRSSEPVIIVHSLDTAIVRKMNVRVGDVLRKGDVIAVLDPTFASADLTSNEAELSMLTARIARLEAELNDFSPFPELPDIGSQYIALEKRVFEYRANEFRARIDFWQAKTHKVKLQLEAINGLEPILRDRIIVQSEIEGMYENLANKGLGKRPMFLRAKNERLALQQQLTNLTDQRLILNGEVHSIESEKAAFSREWLSNASQQLAETQRRRILLIGEQSKAKRRKNLVELRASSDAIVLRHAELSEGSVTASAKPIATLIPQGAVIEGEVEIPSKDIATIRMNDKVRVKLEAFPFQKYGTIEGYIKSITPDALQKTSAKTGAEGSFYRAIIELPKQRMESMPEDVRLTPGMGITAEIVVGRKTVLTYFLYPIIRAWDESIREPR